MNLFENIRLAVAGLLANKMRALLTMLGIIIGIGSVIAITSVGDAMTNVVSSEMQNMGGNNIAVQVYRRDTSGAWIYGTEDLLTDEMIEDYRAKYSSSILGIAMSDTVGNGTIEHRHEENKVSVMGVNDEYATGATGQQVDLARGRFVNESDLQRGRTVAVIAESLAEKLFGAQDPIGKDIKVDLTGLVNGRKTFTVIGTYREQASSFLMGSAGETTTVYIPLTTGYSMQGTNPEGYTYFYVAAAGDIDYQAFAQETADYFNDRYYARNESMYVMTQSMDSIVDQATSMLGTLSLAISVIAAISLLVGGIGVMNIMLVSVTERTREIGIRKALGAPDGAIRLQFIVESMIICAIGGALGILLGGGLGWMGGMLLQAPVAPSMQSVVIAVSFSMLIGVFFGYYPANKAAKLDPIESLRYE